MLTMSAGAVCLDPADPSKYYYPSLEEEMVSANAVVVGTITNVEALSEDPSDPGGWTAFIYKVKINECLLGNVSNELLMRAENDSGGYRVNLGETHLLFLKKREGIYSADPCGNSIQLPEGNTVLDRIRELLQ